MLNGWSIQFNGDTNKSLKHGILKGGVKDVSYKRISITFRNYDLAKLPKIKQFPHMIFSKRIMNIEEGKNIREVKVCLAGGTS